MAPTSAPTPDCLNITKTVPGDVDLFNNRTCYQHIMWAKTQGVIQHPDWYPGLNVNSSIYDFQGAIYSKKGIESSNGTSWTCPKPCVGNMALDLEEAGGNGSSIPPWAWWLLLLLCCLCCALVALAYFLGCFGKKEAAKKKKKQKRALDPVAAAPVAEAAPLMAAPASRVVYAAPPAPTTAMLPATTVVAPPVMAASRSFVAAPAMTAVAPAQYAPAQYAPAPVPTTATPVMTYAAAAPVAYSAAPAYSMVQGGSVTAGAPSMFDQLDVNHDGSISRAEFNAAIMR